MISKNPDIHTAPSLDSNSGNTSRIVAIDLLRGVAILGILLMNISDYSMPDAAYSNPKAYGGNDLLNHMVYNVMYIFADQKFMGIFSLLFGASTVLLLSKPNRMNDPKNNKVVKIYYTRSFWLFIFGFIHTIFIWEGDVLLLYALCSFVLFFFYKLRPRLQIILGVATFLLPCVSSLLFSQQIPHLDTAALQTLQNSFLPTTAEIQNILEIFRGGYLEQVDYRLKLNLVVSDSPATDLITTNFLIEHFARAFGMMLIGMAFYSLGIVTAQRSTTFYRRMLVGGLVIGIPIVSFGLYQHIQHDWDAQYAFFMGKIPEHIATLFMVGAYVAAVMLWSKMAAGPIGQGLKNRLAAVGRMALSNYIGQSLLVTFLMYGWGLGLYGHLDRVSQLGLVTLIWIVQLLVSPWWLERFHYGPLEWLWRCLTYWRIQKFSK